jgi:glycosyltransferase involved in cell wall biosynthesis
MENKISALIITKNSESTIQDCIKSVKDVVDEVIVIDSGSEDKTKQVAGALGAKVTESEFKNFADQRTYAASLARFPWIFYLDSDENLTSEFASELKQKINTSEQNISGYFVRRKTFYLGRDWGFTDRIQRIFRKDKLKGWKGVVHETPEVEGKLGTINAPILHYTHRNLEQMVDKTNEWSEFEADLRLKAHHPTMNAWRFARVMATGFINSYFGQGGWRNGTAGLIEAIFQSFSMFVTYAKLWEKQRKN